MSRQPRDRTRLAWELARLEDEDPTVRAAGERLDEVLSDEASGYARWRRDLVRSLYGPSAE